MPPDPLQNVLEIQSIALENVEGALRVTEAQEKGSVTKKSTHSISESCEETEDGNLDLGHLC